MSNHADEETPLLAKPKVTPLPWGQFSVILVIQLAEPLTSQVIYPFLPQLIRDIGITSGDETKVGYYVGLLQSLFFVTQAMTVLHWSRLSDHVGRKPVILIGLFGLTVSMWCFGLSKTFWGLVLSRAISGALNGNIGVIKSMMAEMTDATNIAQAFAYFPISWCTGLTLGPMVGGFLSRPAEQFPEWFGGNVFLKKYPYFLACAVPATFSAICWLVVFFTLKETVEHATPVSEFIGISRPKGKLATKAISQSDSDNETLPLTPDSEKPLPLRDLLTSQVIISAGNYAFLSLVDIAFRAVQPVFLSTPVSLGGLGLPPAQIGKILSTYGIFNGIFQVCFFAKLNNRWGSKKTYLVGITCTLAIWVLFPILSWLVKREGMSPLVWALVILQTLIPIAMSLAYGSVFIYIAASSPNKASIGATNGICQMTVSIFRAIGPATVNSLYSLTLSKGYMGGSMVYYACVVINLAAVWMGSLLPAKLRV